MAAIVFNYDYLFEVGNVNISTFNNPVYTGDILDIIYREGEGLVDEIPLGTLHAPIDIILPERLETGPIFEIPYVYSPPVILPLNAPLDILYGQSTFETIIEEIPLGVLHAPLDIVFSQRLQTDPLLEIPLGLLNAPLDMLWNTPEIGEMSWDPFPPLPLFPPLDMTMGQDNEDLLFSNLVLTVTGGGETSYTFVG